MSCNYWFPISPTSPELFKGKPSLHLSILFLSGIWWRPRHTAAVQLPPNAWMEVKFNTGWECPSAVWMNTRHCVSELSLHAGLLFEPDKFPGMRGARLSLLWAVVPVPVSGTLQRGWEPGGWIQGTVHGAEENGQVTNSSAWDECRGVEEFASGQLGMDFHFQISASTFCSDISLAPLPMTWCCLHGSFPCLPNSILSHHCKHLRTWMHHPETWMREAGAQLSFH